ncbi:hypothetical protein ACT6QG_05295 [Xanthobacter sp. TB0136]|uniref:hypothetical protein n=1 Tax=Xanthobacter sp. TB0136 TaxID=3459177 RepID=UPI00403938C7
MADVDWCQRAKDLREIEFARVSGQQVAESRFGQDMVKFVSANAEDLAAAIRYAEDQCAKASGKRSRFAMAARARPY